MKVNLAFLQHPKTRPNVEIILIKNSFRNEIEFCILTVNVNKTFCHNYLYKVKLSKWNWILHFYSIRKWHFMKQMFRSDIKFFIFTVSENKTLCHPASVDSLSTSAGTEDHVWML